MKATKRLMALFLALVMTMAMAFPAFADDTTYTITINGSSAGHTYEAYQIFDGDLSGETLSNITWGTGVNGDALLTALKGDDTIGEDFAEAASAADVAKVLTGSEYGDNSENLDAFAAVVGKNLAGSATGTSNGATKNEDKYQYTITGLDAGYYFVKDADDSVAESDAYTKFMLKLVADTEITPKSDVPSVDKKVLEDDKYNQDGGYGQGFNDVADYDIGEEITFKLIGKVPEMDGYDTYKYIFHDTMAEVLELTDENLEDNFTVYIADSQEAAAGTSLTAGSDYTVVAGEDCTFEIRFEDLKSVVGEKENANYIIVTYTARLNSSAEPGLDGYINEVELEFSNNPNSEGEGETGRTPEDKVIVFTYELDVTKIDADTAEEESPVTLPGAEFVLLNEEGTKAAKVDNGTFAGWVDFSEDDVDADDNGEISYDEWVSFNTSNNSQIILTSDDDGFFKIKGLDDGTYTLREIKAPAGYNMPSSPFVVEITATTDNGQDWTGEDAGEALTGLAVTNNGAEGNGDVGTGIADITIGNSQGATLPETGGIGTTIFYILGGVLAVGAGLLLITRRRMDMTEDK